MQRRTACQTLSALYGPRASAQTCKDEAARIARPVHGSNSRQTALRRKRRIGIVPFEASDLVGVSVVAQAFDLVARISSTDSRIGTYEMGFLSRQGSLRLTYGVPIIVISPSQPEPASLLRCSIALTLIALNHCALIKVLISDADRKNSGCK